MSDHRSLRAMRISAVAQALALAFGAASLNLALAPAVRAQSNATSTIYGQLPPGEGLSVVLKNLATGVQRTLQGDANGRFLATSMPPGRYQVQLLRGGAVEKSQEIEALVGQGVEANFVSINSLDTVRVSGGVKRIDVSNTNNGVTFTARELAKLPIAQDIGAIVQLAPGTYKNTNSMYGSAPSIGGSGASENSFYINGFPVTNLLTQVGASELPFGAIANAQVLSGGYSSEFGRSTGGVVNITTKSGSNQWEVGGKLTVVPASWRAKQDASYYPNTGANPLTDGKLISENLSNSKTQTYGLYAGGPLIKDQLFMFAALEQTRSESSSVAPANGQAFSKTGYSESESQVRRYLLKLDYHLNDSHHFEYTRIGDRTRGESKAFGYDYAANRSDGIQSGGSLSINCCGAGSAPGAEVDVLKYTGYLNDDVTVTALYGESKTKHSLTPFGYKPGIYQTSSSVATRVPGLSYPTGQTTGGDLPAPGSGDGQKVLRLDAEYRLGKHSLRAGIDHIKVESVVGKSQAGGGLWSYRKMSDPNTKPFKAFESPLQGGGFGTQGFYVSEVISYSIATPTSTQSAQYIQDRYQVTKDILLDLGLRNEQFTNNNSEGKPFISQKRMLAPRLGATWDFNGDGSTKLFAHAGRYHLPVPSNLSSNLASPFRSTDKFYTYTGVDPVTGAPTGLHAISDVVSANNAFGQSKDPRTIVAIDLKPLYQDELALGFEKSLSKEMVVGGSLNYRTLRSTNDDTCDQRPIDAWGEAHGVDTSHYGFPCAVINPGEANSLWLDLAGDGKLTRVDISAEAWGNPKVKRSYLALNLFAEHPMRNGWYGRVNYTWSRSKGNAEGQIDSISGGDVALTVGTDLKELMLHSYGYLPNDHTHSIRAYGLYQLAPEWTVGGNLNLTSGRPRNCKGNVPESVVADQGYGAAYFFCDGKPAPRGSFGRTPWTTQLDLNLAYSPSFVKGLTAKFLLLNVLNKKTATSYNEVREEDDHISPHYQEVTSRMSPRSARLTVEYNHAF